MKRYLIPAGIVIALAAAVGIYRYTGNTPEATYKTTKVERGDIVSSVAATGNLTAVVTVQVGTQVSGTIQKLFVDFNSLVKKGQVIAQIDPALFNAQVEQTRGNYLSAQAGLEKAKADLVDAKRTLERNRQLLQGGIVAQGDFDTSETKYDQALAGIKSAEGSIAQTRGAYSQARTNLQNATIRSPVDGVVISRAIDVGQTVAASFQTPTLFTIAQDLTRMQIETSVDEADISRVRVGQPVSFTVDAYPEVKFKARVAQIRNAPVITQNVVTYVVIITVDNPELKLKPGMTANVGIEVGKRENVLMIPMAALRFKPQTEKEKTVRPASPAQGMGKRTASQQVYILSPENKPLPVKVQTGLGNDSQVEIVSETLKEGDEVIVQSTGSKEKQGMGGGGHSMRMRF